MYMKMGPAKIAFLFMLSAARIVPQLSAQVSDRLSVSVRGEVRYAEGGKLADNVLVRLEEFEGAIVGQARTDRTGKFEFMNMRKGRYLISANLTGYQGMSQEIDLTMIANPYIILTLMRKKTDADTGPKVPPGTVLDARVPKEAREEYAKGRTALLGRADTKTGISHLEKAVKIYPEYLEAQLLLGTAYLDFGKLDKAEAALKNAIRIDPKLPQALWALGELYREKKDYEEAEKTLIQGTALNDGAPQGHLALGRLYLEMGNLQKAGPEIGRTLQLNPKEAEAYIIAGNIFLKAGRAQEALEMYSEYLKLEPKGKWAEAARRIVEKIQALIEKK